MTTVSRLEEIAARVAAASPGPWSICMDEIHVEVAPYFLQPTGADTAFIDAVRDDVPFLLAEISRRDAEIESLKAALAECGVVE
jgi:hypothetical protein